MAKPKKTIDDKKLLDMIKNETEQSEIMKEFGFKTSHQLKIAYMNALIQAGEAPEIKSTTKRRKKKTVDIKVTVNKKGSLSIPSKVIEDIGFKIGQAFQLKKTQSGIQLKIVNTLEENKSDKAENNKIKK